MLPLIQSAVPSVAPDEVLLSVSAAALSSFDVKCINNSFPQIYHSNAAASDGNMIGVGTVVSGVVVQIGSAVTDVTLGQSVIGVLHPSSHSHSNPCSALAQYVSLPRHALIQYLNHTTQIASDVMTSPSPRVHAAVAALTGAVLSNIRSLPPPASLAHLPAGALVVYITGKSIVRWFQFSF